MKNLPNMRKNVTFQMVFVKNESGCIRVHPQPLYMFCIIIKYNLHFNIMNEHECGHFTIRTFKIQFKRSPSPMSKDVTKEISLNKGEQYCTISFDAVLPNEQYGFITFLANNNVSIQTSEERYSGILSVFNGVNKAVSNNGKQTPPDGIGVDTFEFWIPHRRPEGKNIAMEISPALSSFNVANLGNGYVRPSTQTNAWIADTNDAKPSVKVEWNTEQTISEIKLFLDTDYDHPMESTLYGHPESVIPFCIQNYVIKDLNGTVLASIEENHQTINTIKFKDSITTKGFTIEVAHPSKEIPAAIFEILCS